MFFHSNLKRGDEPNYPNYPPDVDNGKYVSEPKRGMEQLKAEMLVPSLDQVLLPCFVCEYTAGGQDYRCFVSGVSGKLVGVSHRGSSIGGGSLMGCCAISQYIKDHEPDVPKYAMKQTHATWRSLLACGESV